MKNNLIVIILFSINVMSYAQENTKIKKFSPIKSSYNLNKMVYENIKNDAQSVTHIENKKEKFNSFVDSDKLFDESKSRYKKITTSVAIDNAIMGTVVEGFKFGTGLITNLSSPGNLNPTAKILTKATFYGVNKTLELSYKYTKKQNEKKIESVILNEASFITQSLNQSDLNELKRIKGTASSLENFHEKLGVDIKHNSYATKAVQKEALKLIQDIIDDEQEYRKLISRDITNRNNELKSFQDDVVKNMAEFQATILQS